MYTLKGFINIGALANNAPGTATDGDPSSVIPGNTSPLGELSDISSTYSIEKGTYRYAQSANCELKSFSSRRDGGPQVIVSAKYSEHVLKLSQWIFDQAVAGRLSNDVGAFKTLFLAQFGNIIKDFECGKMYEAKGNWMPAYIEWQLDDKAETNKLRVWFADEAFRNQYDEYQLVVIPPIEPVDTFQKVRTEVEKAMAKFNVPDHHKKVLELTKGEPYTLLHSDDYKWYDREDPTSTLMTTWSVAIYGAAGNSLEIIKDALADYILANSDFDRPDWIPVFPDIFTSTEFQVIPMWHRHSVPDETVRGALYSPIVPYDGLLPLLEKFVTYTPKDHLAKYLQLAGIQYKSLAAAFIGGPENRDQKYVLTDFFPDYAMLSTTSPDFNRMDEETVAWVVKLVEATITAEEMDEYSHVGRGYARIWRGELMYISFAHQKVSYLVLSRLSMLKALEVEEPK